MNKVVNVTWSLLTSIVTLVSLFAAVPVSAQTYRPERPYRGLFAGGLGPEVDQALVATGSIGAGWDDNLVANALGRNFERSSDLTRQFRGGLGTSSAGLSYLFRRDRFAFGAHEAASMNYYPSFSDPYVFRDYSAARASVQLAEGLSAGAGATYRPYSVLTFFPSLVEPQPGETEAAFIDFPASREHYFGYSGGLQYSRRLAARMTISADYAYSARAASALMRRSNSQLAAAQVARDLGAGLRLYLRYRYWRRQYPDAFGQFDYQTIDAGLDFSRRLSFTRRTTLSFSTGTSVIADPEGRRETQYHARALGTGTFRIDHEIGRTWNAGLAYVRGVGVSESWPEPVITDSATATLGGLLNRRVQLLFSARAARGSSTFEGDRHFTAYNGYGLLALGLTRYVGAGLSYSYYRHQFDDGLVLAPGLTRDFDRQSVRAFLSVWAPLYTHSRRP